MQHSSFRPWVAQFWNGFELLRLVFVWHPQHLQTPLSPACRLALCYSRSMRPPCVLLKCSNLLCPAAACLAALFLPTQQHHTACLGGLLLGAVCVAAQNELAVWRVGCDRHAGTRQAQQHRQLVNSLQVGLPPLQWVLLRMLSSAMCLSVALSRTGDILTITFCLYCDVCFFIRPAAFFCCRSAWLYMGIVVDFLICMRIARYMRIHVGLKAFYQVRGRASTH